MQLLSFVLASTILSLTPARPASAQTRLFDELHRMLPAESDSTRAVALGDVDGDGDSDALIGNYGDQNRNRLYLNDGTGIFADATANLPDDDDNTYAVALGDVDGDGDLDALIGNGPECNPWSCSGGRNRLYLNDGAGVFSDATANLPADSEFSYAVALGDVDGDGDIDALIGNTPNCAIIYWGCFGGQNRLYLNDGAGVFADATANLPLDDDRTQTVALGDVDGDGDPDALIGNDGDQNRLYLNDGTGVFADATVNLPADSDDTRAVALADVDRDGVPDVLIGNFGEQNRLYLNSGTGVFADATAYLPADSDVTVDVALGDVDTDGDLDALIGNVGQNRLYLNDGAGVFADATANLPTDSDNTFATALGDVDGDGDADALIGNIGSTSGDRNRLYLNDGTGLFADATASFPEDSDRSAAVALGDVDGDGHPDALIGNDSGQKNRLYINDGTGLFANATANLPPHSDDTSAVALGDVDGDGDADALIGNSGFFGPGDQNRLYLNDGTGVFADATANLPTDSDYAQAVALGDVDRDGDLDALIGNDPDNRLYLNDGTGVFADATVNLPTDSDHTFAVALGDVDGDSDLDALIGNHVGQDRLYLNDGTGVFADATANLPAHSDLTFAVALGDVDGDLDLDALIGNSGSQNRLYLNDGTGVFADATANLPADSDYTQAVALGDVDADGDLDALIGNTGGVSSGQQNRLYLNDGTGVFADATPILPADADNTQAVALGDVDADGDPDALIGNFYEQVNRLYTNLNRQLAWHGLPRVGKPLAMDLYGTPGGPWFLAWSPGTASIPFPPFGTIKLDPSSAFVVGSGTLDAEGFASMTFRVPDNPALVGASRYWQALIGSRLFLSNLEVTTLTNL